MILSLRKILIALPFVALLLCGATSLPAIAAEKPAKRVFVLNSFNRGYVWTDNMLRGIDDTFAHSDPGVETYVSFMDTKRIPPSPPYFAQFKDLLRTGYKGFRFDAVLACDNDALEFLRTYRDELFPGVPVVFASINDFNERMLDGRKDITGTSENTDYEGTIRCALKLRPATTRIVVVTDGTTTGNAHRSAVEKMRGKFPPDLAFVYLSLGDMTLDELGQALSKLRRDSVVLLLHHFVDKNGTTYTVPQSTPRLTRRSSVPVFVLSDIRMGLGALGGRVTSGYHHGQAAAEMVARILGGAPVESIPVLLDSPNKYMFDFQVMTRFNISERDLPEGSILINKPVSVWAVYKKEWLITLGVFLVLCAILFYLLLEIKRRKTSEETLRQSQSLLYAVSEGTSDAVYVKDSEGRYLLANSATARFFGKPVKDVLGRNDSTWFPAVEAGKIMTGDRRIMESGVTQTHEEVVTIGGGRHTFLTTKGPVHDIEGKVVGVFGVSHDITKRKQAEEAQKNAERLYRDLFEQANEGLLLMTTTGQLVQINSVFAEMHGYRLEELKTKNITELDVLQDRTIEDRADILHRLNAGETVRFDVEHYHREGHILSLAVSTRQVTLDGQPFFLASHLDITERKQAEAEIVREQALTKTIIDSIPGTFYMLDEKGEYVRWNAFQRDEIVGKPEDQVAGTSALTTIHPDDREFIQMKIASVLGSGKEQTVEARVLLRGGPAFLWLLMTGRPITIEGRPFLVGTGIDITERKQRAAEHEILLAQLAQAQKIESIGRLAGGVAHDFNNLLLGILNYVDLCRDKLPPEHPIRPILDEITTDAQRSADLTRQLLAFARKQTIAPKVLDLNDMLAGMLKMLGRLLGENITLTWSPGPNLWKVKLDPSQVDQILANLCVNARDAIAGVGRLTIGTSNITVDEPYGASHADAVPGEYVLLIVSDTGHGMKKEVLDHVFEPFFTTKELGKGTGLGLATVFGIVTQNKGFITVYSEPGKGTTFKIHLPRFAEPVSAEAPVTAPPGTRPRGTETILLVEDEKSIRVTTTLFLENLGYNMLVADDPAKALALAAQHPGEIHLLITDVIMPNMSGSDLAKRLLEQRPSIQCLFISGFTADVIAQEGILEAGVHFLSKPFSRDVIAQKVREVLG